MKISSQSHDCRKFKIQMHKSVHSHSVMASSIDWSALLEKKYSSYKVEVKAFLDSLDITNSIEISTQIIYDAIKFDSTVNENLKCLYWEAISGTNKEVKNRIRTGFLISSVLSSKLISVL